VLVKKVRDKLNEYGFNIFSDYELEENPNDYLFIIEYAVIFISRKAKTIGIAFQVTTKPERAGNIALIINEIGYPVHIMESFIFDQNRQFISGEKAYQLIQEVNKESVKNEIDKEQTYKQYLYDVKGYEC